MIYVVIAVHNRNQLTAKCLACLRAQTEPHRVVVVDDGSTDGTAALIARDFPDVTVLTGTGSLWWTGGTNLGIRYVLEHDHPASDDFVLTLNDDTEVTPDYLTTLLRAYRSNPPGIIGSVSVDIREPDRLLYAGTRLNRQLATFQDVAAGQFNNQYDQLATGPACLPTDCLPGRGMLIPKPVFDAIGLFDDHHFPHHMADLDFSLRARKAGFPLLVATRSIVYEHADATGLQLNKPVSLRAFWRALFATRSPIKLTTRYQFARRHAPILPLYLILDLSRIVGGYFLHQLNLAFTRFSH